MESKSKSIREVWSIFQFDNAVEHFKTFVVTVQFYQEKREMSCIEFQ